MIVLVSRGDPSEACELYQQGASRFRNCHNRSGFLLTEREGYCFCFTQLKEKSWAPRAYPEKDIGLHAGDSK